MDARSCLSSWFLLHQYKSPPSPSASGPHMTAEPYLPRLNARLARGLTAVPPEVRDKHARFLKGKQAPDGGFPGREGGSDLYYTGFALRTLAVCQSLTPEVCESAANFLRERMRQPAGVVDFFSLVVSCYLVPLGGGP